MSRPGARRPTDSIARGRLLAASTSALDAISMTSAGGASSRIPAASYSSMKRRARAASTQLPSWVCAETPCRTRWIRDATPKNTFSFRARAELPLDPAFMHKSFAVIVLLTAVGCVTSSTTTSTIQPAGTLIVADAALYEKARGIHERVFAIDTHVDIPAQWSTTPQNDADSGTAQVTFRKMKQGGLDGAFFAVYVGQGPRTPAGDSSAKAAAMQKFHGIHRSVDTLYKDKVEIAYQPEDVPKILARNKLVAAIGIENGWVIGHDLSLIGKYYDLGARYMTLAHTSNNDICDSSTDPRGPEHNGLSAFGREVVREMNRVGMMVDVSHVSKQCMLQATALSTSPVIASHSSTTAVANVPRNFDDEMLAAIAANGGVMQTVAYASYVKVFPAQRDSDLAKLNSEFYPTDSIPVWRTRDSMAAAGRAGGG